MTNEERAARVRKVKVARAISARMAAAAMQNAYERAVARGQSVNEAVRRGRRAYDLVFGKAMVGWLQESAEGLAAAAASFGLDVVD